jgi:hypothetical protein
MAFIPAPGIAQAELVFTWNEQTVEMVLNFQGSGAWSATTLDLLGSSLVSWFQTYLAPLLSTQIQLRIVRVRDLTTVNGVGVEHSSGLPSGGLINTASVPNNVAIAVKHSTGLTGRSFRGRSFVPGLAAGDINVNTLLPDSLTALRNAFANLNVVSNVNGAVHVVLSKYHGVDSQGKPIPRATAIATPVLSYSVDPTVDSQRRRLPGRGQ